MPLLSPYHRNKKLIGKGWLQTLAQLALPAISEALKPFGAKLGNFLADKAGNLFTRKKGSGMIGKGELEDFILDNVGRVMGKGTQLAGQPQGGGVVLAGYPSSYVPKKKRY